MGIVELSHIIIGTAICLFLIVFGSSSIRERKSRAAFLSLIMLIAFGSIWFGGYILFKPSPFFLSIPNIITLFMALLFFMPFGKRSSIKVGDITERVDERDIMFARNEYEPGTEKYDKYYADHPELKKIDDRIRKLPEFLSHGGRYYDQARSAEVQSIFKSVRSFLNHVDGEIDATRQQLDKMAITKEMKEMVLEHEAADVGVARLNPAYVYSRVGRGPEPWGAPINNNHTYAIVFTLEMDYFKVEQAPRLPITEESAAQYLNAAKLSIPLAEYIRNLGYPARAHISGSNYQIMLPAVAYDAGLGELGRLNYLISPKLGARVRLGAVTTDLPLIPDKPINFGVQNFCARCKKCATNCPSGSIASGGKTDIRGVEKWTFDIEKCFRYWKAIGTDCGLCMKVCPYSHPPTFTHNTVRAGIKSSSFAQIVSAWADDLFYGKKVKF
ncbi:MAG: reductive dehalogenase [candidate division Zixibacteria bacterium]|nr:reductive dehalogenase [candidate division Zixibacteria bacterium]